MNQLLIALNVVIPVFITIGIGAILKHLRIITDDFVKVSMKLVFLVCLPGLLFIKVADADISAILSLDSLKFSFMVVIVTIFMFGLATIFAKKYVPPKSRGSFVQGSFRSNYIIIGYAILYNLFGDLIVSRMALLVIVVVPLYNIISIMILSQNSDLSLSENLKLSLKKVVTNPLIIGIVLGFVVALLDIQLPEFFRRTIQSLGSVGTPLGLIGIGSYLTLSGLKIKTSLPAVVFKLILNPLVIVLIAHLLGYGYMDKTILFVLFGAPAAISSFIMASALGGDSQMAANIVIISTGLSLFTFLGGLTLMAHLFN